MIYVFSKSLPYSFYDTLCIVLGVSNQQPPAASYREDSNAELIVILDNKVWYADVQV